MRHVLNFTTLESFVDEKEDKKATDRHPTSNFEKSVRPYLDRFGRSKNHTNLRGFGLQNHTDHTSMSSLGLLNDLDMQLYGYALHLCETLADKYDQEANATKQKLNALPTSMPVLNVTAISATPNITTNLNITKANDVLEGYFGCQELPKFFTMYTFVVVLMLAICRQMMCRKMKFGSPRSGSSGRMLQTPFAKQ